MNTIDVLYAIGKQYKQIHFFLLHEFPEQQLIQQTITNWSLEEEEIFNYALHMKKQYHLLFWDGIMLGSINNTSYSPRFLKAALRHNDIKKFILIKIEEILVKHQTLINNYPRIAVCSKVIMKDYSIQHIPMIDFHLPISNKNLLIIKDYCHILGLEHGFILNSGESYHFIGNELMSWNSLYKLLTQSLLLSPIVDKSWISHQLIEKSCSLRINKKHNIYPQVIAQI